MIAELREMLSCKFLILLLLALFTFTGCGSSDSSSSDKGDNSLGIIKGTVTAASNIAFKGKSSLLKTSFAGNAGVSDVVCTLEGTHKSTTTDENGFFQITNVAAGSYILICKKTATDGKVYAFLEIVEVQGGDTVDLGTVEIKKAGSIQGKGTLTEQTYHTGISVYIPGTSMEARTDAIGEYLIHDVPEGTYELHFEKDGYVTGKLMGILVTGGQTTLAGDINLNLSAGATGSISIENGKVYANSRTVTVYITASEDVKLYQMSDNPNFIGAVWNPMPTSRTWIFDSDGEKRLYIKFADANGLESAPVSDTIIVDADPPVNGSVSINNGASAINTTTVSLNLSVTDVTTSVSQMMISNDPDFTNAEWESIANTRSWTIPAGDGVKTVYVKYKDIVGNETTQAISDSITLDTTLPIGPSITIQEVEYTNNPQIHLNLSAAGATLMKISEDQTFAGVSPIPLVPTTTFTLSGGDGHKTVYVKYLDDAGNETESLSSSIILDTSIPTTPVIFNQNQTTNQITFEMTLSADSMDANFANYQLKGGQYTDWTDTSETSAFRFTLTQQGQNILSIRGKDKVGNIGNAANVTINLDTVTPVISDIKAEAGVRRVVISWKTSEPTYGKVDFGFNENYGSALEDSTFTTDHAVSTNELTAGTIYHYRIKSSDAGANDTFSTDLTFITYKIKAIAAGSYHVCALTTSGGVKCWGNNDLYWSKYLPPVDVPGLSTEITAIAAGGGTSTCALTIAGGVKCWGWSSKGASPPIDVPGLSTGITAIAAGSEHFCALTTTSGVKCWDIVGTNGTSSTPVDVPGISTGIKAITTGGDHSCALTTAGGVKCWGSNRWGQLGDGTTTDRLTPVDVSGLSTGVTAVTAGGSRSCALTTAGGVKCWGLNDRMSDTDYRNSQSGSLGDGTTTNRHTPVDVSGLTTGVTAVTAGLAHTCAITTSGGVMCWGNNKTSQCGCAETYCLTPYGRSTGNAIVGVSVVDTPYGNTYIQGYTCVIYSYGGIGCWGSSPGASWN